MILLEAQPTNGWDVLMGAIIFAWLAFFCWMIFRA